MAATRNTSHISALPRDLKENFTTLKTMEKNIVEKFKKIQQKCRKYQAHSSLSNYSSPKLEDIYNNKTFRHMYTRRSETVMDQIKDLREAERKEVEL